jgi:SNF family Na+-dependent transporter
MYQYLPFHFSITLSFLIEEEKIGFKKLSANIRANKKVFEKKSYKGVFAVNLLIILFYDYILSKFFRNLNWVFRSNQCTVIRG